MKKYRIKLDNTLLYIKCVFISPEGFEMGLAFGDDEIGIFEEDKAKTYCKELNDNKKYKEVNMYFSLEPVE